MSRFAGKSVVITGGSSGIGLETARRIVDEGGRVLVTGRNASKLTAAEALGIHVLENDAADPAAADALAAEARRLFGEIDAAFFSAGVGGHSPLGEITLETFRRVFDVNVAGTLFGAQALAPLMKRGGSMVLTSSGARTKGIPGVAVYSGSKGAVRSITLVLARELAPKGIRVNTLSPGPIDTPLYDGLPPGAREQLYQVLASANPMNRVGDVGEAAAVATFLLSDESSFVTGADYPVDGGEANF